MITLEVKVDGSTNRKTATYEPIWLDWNEFQILRTQKRASPFRQLVTNGKQAFEILRGKVRERYLIKHGYDPNAKYEGAA
jgi:hypothetical protein